MNVGTYTVSLSAQDMERFTRAGDESVRLRLAANDAGCKVREWNRVREAT